MFSIKLLVFLGIVNISRQTTVQVKSMVFCLENIKTPWCYGLTYYERDLPYNFEPLGNIEWHCQKDKILEMSHIRFEVNMDEDPNIELYGSMLHNCTTDGSFKRIPREVSMDIPYDSLTPISIQDTWTFGLNV